MKKFFLVLSLIFVLLAAVSTIGGAATINDLVEVPTASLMTPQYIATGEIFTDYKKIEVVTRYSGVEFGGNVKFLKDNSTEVGMIGKIPLIAETDNKPAVLMGVKDRALYVVASKDLGNNTGVHVGIGNHQLSGVFVGINKVINSGAVSINEDQQQGKNNYLPPVNLMAGYADGKFNCGVHVNIQQNVYFKFALLDLEKA
ncbi:MAG: hypothetical protein ACOCQH_02925, partial [Halanaerobiales bacterium]